MHVWVKKKEKEEGLVYFSIFSVLSFFFLLFLCSFILPLSFALLWRNKLINKNKIKLWFRKNNIQRIYAGLQKGNNVLQESYINCYCGWEFRGTVLRVSFWEHSSLVLIHSFSILLTCIEAWDGTEQLRGFL